MHLHFERNSNARCDCAILSLTWMGKVPDELPEEEGWKLNRTNYYQEGWLATGNVRGIVGVTFTTSHCRKNPDFPLRTNYNLRGHRSEVILVKWNEPYQKLASCDSSGIIFVWIKYEGRWSIELINDRNTPVTHFAWSHDGRMALICYQDGFVLVGSVAGQRYWSSMLSLESTITCGIWTPDDQQVYFGTTSGRLIVMDVHGAMVSQVQLAPDHGPITAMAWSCEKFKMEESDEGAAAAAASSHLYPSPTGNEERSFVLAVSLKSGVILLMKNFDDVSPVLLRTGLLGICMEWSNSRELLAVAGTRPTGGDTINNMEPLVAAPCNNVLLFYSDTGTLVYSAPIPYTQSPVTALTWGHNDKRLFVATGCHVHIAWVSRRIASLQLLSGLRTHEQLRGELQVASLPLPPRIRALVTNLFAQTIRVSECFVPEVQHIREFVSRPPVGSVRLHCTMIRHDEESSAGICYTLYLEYLGGLVPLLKGKRTSKIRPEFVIFDPQHDDSAHDCTSNQITLKAPVAAAAATTNAPTDVGQCSDSSDSEHDEGCASPRVQRRKRRRRKSQGSPGTEEVEDLTYVDTLPEHVRLVQVTSNIWGTKFKIHGLATSLPANLGHVTYKTSLLHLQPRQMTLVMTELRDDVPPGPDPSFNPNLFSEDEEEVPLEHERLLPSHTDIAPIAPMTPRPQSARSRFQTRTVRTPSAREPLSCEESGYRSTTSSGGAAPRHTLPPLCGGDTQSPKHTVAPRDSMDVLTDTQSAEYSSSVHRIKSSMMNEAASSSTKDSIVTSSVRTKRREKATSATCHKPQRRDDDLQPQQQQGPSKRSPVVSSLPMDPMVRSCSVGYLDLVDLALNSHGPLGDLNQNETPPKRLVLVHKKKEQPKPKLKHCGKSKSLDSSDIFPKEGVSKSSLLLAAASELTAANSSSNKDASSPSASLIGAVSGGTAVTTPKSLVQTRREVDSVGRVLLINAADGMNSLPNSGGPRLPHSTPTSPAMAKKNRSRNHSPIRRQLLNSPLLSRRARKGRSATESSDDEVTAPGEDARNFRDLETFQKAQLRQKLRRGKGAGGDCASSRRRELVMHNKAPMWNENSQVYQLDFGGRVTQESAKNFQIEFRGKQVMQFGRIDGNAYTLDFQYPFSALQAFAVALANVTQRLK